MRQRGFTLIELVMTVAVIAILAAIAFPAYSAYTIRARVSEGIMATGPCKIAVTEVYQFGLNGSTQPDGWGCGEGSGPPSVFVDAIHTDAFGSIIVTLNRTDPRLGPARGQDIILTPVGGNLNNMLPSSNINEWTCSPGPTMPPQYLPGSCRP